MAESRGRPLGSEVRQNVIDVLAHMGKAYGYQIHKVYKDLFPPVTLRTIYYHLQKGITLDLFKVEKIKESGGDYSWGTTAEKTYYSLTAKANPRQTKALKEYFK
ncbi:hypothetical protein ACFL1B_01770 [Nanoarchaeota archaeon]